MQRTFFAFFHISLISACEIIIAALDWLLAKKNKKGNQLLATEVFTTILFIINTRLYSHQLSARVKTKKLIYG